MAFPLYDKLIFPSQEGTMGNTAYTAGDVVGPTALGANGYWTFDLAGSSSGGGLINWAMFIDNDSKAVAGDLYIFNDVPTAVADNASFVSTFGYAGWLLRQTKISTTTYDSGLTSRCNQIMDVNDEFKAVDGKHLYGYFVTTGTPTFTNGAKLTIMLGILTQ